MSVKIIINAKKNPSTCGIKAHVIVNGKYSKSGADDSKIVFDEIINVMHILSATLINTIPTNVYVVGNVNYQQHTQ